MKHRRAEPSAVFDGRDAMEEAVRGLVEKGIRPTSIRISQGVVDERDHRVEPVPERGGAIASGLAIGAISGALVWLLWMVMLRDVVPITVPLVIERLAGGAASGALFGAVFALLLDPSFRRRRGPSVGMPGEFIVTVKPPSEEAAGDVREFLADHGGHLVPTPA